MVATNGGADERQLVRPSHGSGHGRLARRVQRSVGAVLLLVAVVLLTYALLALAQTPDSVGGSTPRARGLSGPAPAPSSLGHGAADTGPAAPRSTSAADKARRDGRMTTPPAAQPDGGSKQHLRPARVRIPLLAVDRRPVPLRVLGDGSLAAPRRYRDVGWWKDGPLPGTRGNAVVVGHVDSETGPAVFYGLASLQRGDQIMVTRRDSVTVQFAVRSVERFPLDHFPANRVYRRGGPPGLVLLTCGGKYDRAVGRYQDNVVVFASPSGGPDRPLEGRPRRTRETGAGVISAG